MQTTTRHTKGFTLIELLIVIVVIAILAAIAFISYNGIVAQARDSTRKSDLAETAKALSLYQLSNKNTIESGSGCGVYGNGNGWLSAGPADLGATLYPKSIISCLQSAGVLGSGKFTDPTGCKWDSSASCGSWDGKPVTAYMKASCTKDGTKIAYIFASLTSGGLPAATIDGLCDSGSVTGFTNDGQKWGTHYGMNYYVTVQ